MCYTNTKCFDCLQGNSSEYQTKNEVAEEEICTIISLKQEETLQSTRSSAVSKYLNKPLGGKLKLTALVALIMLEGATGYEYTCRISTDDFVPKELCSIASNICKIININITKGENVNFDKIIKEAYYYSANLMKMRDIFPIFPLSVPLLLPSDDNNPYDCDGKTSPMQYYYMNSYIEKIANRMKNSLDRESLNTICISDRTEFCSSEKNHIADSDGWIKPNYFIRPNDWIFNKCCPSIESHITYPALSLYTDISTTLVIVLVSFLSLAIFIIALMRYRFCKSSKKIDQIQGVPASDNDGNDLAENIV